MSGSAPLRQADDLMGHGWRGLAEPARFSPRFVSAATLSASAPALPNRGWSSVPVRRSSYLGRCGSPASTHEGHAAPLGNVSCSVGVGAVGGVSQQPQAVGDDDQAGAHVGEDRDPQ